VASGGYQGTLEVKCLKIQRKSLDLRVLPDSWSETDLRFGIRDIELTRKCRSWRTMVITRYTRGEKPELKCRFGCVGGVYGKNGPRIRNFHGRLWGICLAYMVLGPILTSLSFRRRGGGVNFCKVLEQVKSYSPHLLPASGDDFENFPVVKTFWT